MTSCTILSLRKAIDLYFVSELASLTPSKYANCCRCNTDAEGWRFGSKRSCALSPYGARTRLSYLHVPRSPQTRYVLRTPLFRLHPAYTLSRSDALICVCVCCVMGRSRTLERPCPAFERSAPLMSLLFLCLYVTKPSIRDIVTVCLLLPSSTVHGNPHTKVLSPNAELGGHLCQCLSPS